MKELFVKHNSIGFIIKIAGLVVLVWGFFQGILISAQFSQQNMGEWEVAGPVGGFSLFSFLSILFTHAIYGIVIIGFGEVIDLLQKIYDQKSPKPVLPDPVRTSPIPLSSEQEIRAFYSKMNVKVESVSPTKSRDVFSVKVDGVSEFIELGGLSPRLLSEEEAEKKGLS